MTNTNTEIPCFYETDGKVIIVVGASGGGKTTLLKPVLKFTNRAQDIYRSP